jgi:hypothetical protein
MRVAHYDITKALRAERQLGDLKLRLEELASDDTRGREQAVIELRVCQRNYLRLQREVRRRAPSCAVTAEEVNELLEALHVPGQPIVML